MNTKTKGKLRLKKGIFMIRVGKFYDSHLATLNPSRARENSRPGCSWKTEFAGLPAKQAVHKEQNNDLSNDNQTGNDVQRRGLG
jgi:hypothetical protein